MVHLDYRNKNIRKNSAFTLIELLVVIAIIALLLAILMPSLGKAKKIAQALVCRTRMKQWSIVTNLYGNDNDYRFCSATFDGNWGGGPHWWMGALRPYYSEPDIRLCPSAKTPADLSNRKANDAWATVNYFPELEDGIEINGTEYIFGSLGPNGWLISLKPGFNFGGGINSNAIKGKSWERLTAVPAYVPLFLDS